MGRSTVGAAALAVLCAAQPALARDFCPDRPGLDTPACTVEPGRVSAEVSLGDWAHDDAPDALSDVVQAGVLALRYGVADHAELRLGWTAYGHSRTRDKAAGTVDTASGTGDIVLGIKRNLIHPDGKGLSIAILPQATLPTGGQAIGLGDWGAGMQVPVSYALTEKVSLALTPEVDAAVNASRGGRHLAYGTAGGVTLAPANGLSLSLEASVFRDADPAGASIRALFGAALGWALGANAQVDVGGAFGLNSNTPALHLYMGIARRF